MALTQKKFGAFSGVFTPSILTILGVIMYMRLGWITGQAGLVNVVLIILLAHVISITTGLSISSIATDKKIRTGGIYYILSRSLGLPFGGSLGITMFIGTSLSVSLYIIGFAENFLGIEAVRNFLGMGETLDDYRLVGTFVIIFLTIITLISTSVAIKAQFIILGAIVISLLAVVFGLIGNGYSPADPSIKPAAEGVSFAVIFAIFFPAVTGFTAGVAMSGDLKDPRKDIPFGTMASIAVGLVVYLTLAVVFAVYIDRELLLTDNNFLMKVAVFAPLVIAGIWGATLSSAIGGLLGGPRILQAMSNDRITPKIFGKGYGINNEPRNALLLTFLIAEGGILIGSLDVIASIVSMFYIAAYGFINLSFALEKWASSDFRPSFRISKWVGILGFVASFIVMFKIDSTAMLLAILILAGIYYFVKKKKLELDFGDVWQSVWSSIIRTTLNSIDKKGLEERNWRPNIILFSGGTSNRPHLIHFGKDLVTNKGLLSNFDLIQNKSAQTLLKKHQQAVNDDEDEGVFTRRHECNDIYEGIETIASTYGFSGIEPNTVLMGWGRQSEDPIRFVRMLKTLSDLDLNIIMLDYDKKHGFGKYEVIDIWCRGGGNNCNLVVSLVKFMWMSERWEDARVRILLINPVNEERDAIYEEAMRVLERLRIDAEVKVINNQIEQRPVNEIIRIESGESDLIFLGIPDIRPGQEKEYVETVNYLCNNIGTVALVKASSYFKEFTIGSAGQSYGRQKDKLPSEKSRKTEGRDRMPEVRYPASEELAEPIKVLYERITRVSEELNKKYFNTVFSRHNKTLDEISRITDKYFKNLEEYFIANASFPHDPEYYTSYLEEVMDYIKDQPREVFEEQKESLYEALDTFSASISGIAEDQPEFITKDIHLRHLVVRKSDTWPLVWFKTTLFPLVVSSTKPYRYKIRYSDLVHSYFPEQANIEMFEVFRNWGLISFQFIHKTRQFIKAGFDAFMSLESASLKGNLKISMIREEREKMDDHHQQLRKLNEDSKSSLYRLLLNKNVFIIQQLSNDVQYIHTNRRISKKRRLRRAYEIEGRKFNELPEIWFSNQLLNNNLLILHQQGLLLNNSLRHSIRKLQKTIDDKFRLEYKEQVKQLIDDEDWKMRSTEQKRSELEYIFDVSRLSEDWSPILEKKNMEMLNACGSFAEEIKILPTKGEDYKQIQFEEKPPLLVKARSLITEKVREGFVLKTDRSIELMIESLGNLPENHQQDDDGGKKIMGEMDNIHSRIANHLQERITATGDILSIGAIIDYFRKQVRKK